VRKIVLQQGTLDLPASDTEDRIKIAAKLPVVRSMGKVLHSCRGRTSADDSAQACLPL